MVLSLFLTIGCLGLKRKDVPKSTNRLQID
jgi:hypothetical protein